MSNKETNKIKESKEHNISTRSKSNDSIILAAVRIRGSINVNKDIYDTLTMLNLNNQHNCCVYNRNPSVLGMLQKAKDYLTWGEVDNDTIKLLEEKRKEADKKIFRLHPPRGGFERKGIKRTFKTGGALGYRGKKINDLIKKMI